MEDSSLISDLFRLAAIAILMLVNAFFVAAEFSLVSVRKSRIEELVAQGDISAEAVQRAIHNPDQVIAATQLGITLASLGLGWLSEPALAHLLEPVVLLFPGSVQSGVSHALSAVIAFVLIAFLHVVVGELAPKSIALQNPEGTSLAVARPTLALERVFRPAIWLMNKTGNALLRLFGVEPASGYLVRSIEELKMIVSASAEGGVVQAEESEMLHKVFDFGSLVVRQLMIPRTEMVAVEANTPLPEIIQLVTRSSFTKLPVYEDNLDQILGIVHVRDLLAAMQRPDCENCTARQFVRETLYVPETLSVSALLKAFRDNRQHIAIVLDEFGGNAGLITLEDLLEEIVGEVNDPFDVADPEIQERPDGTVIIDGLTLIDEVNEQLNLRLVDPYYDTIAGFVLGRLGRIPLPADEVQVDGIVLKVEEMDGMRIARLSLKRLENGSVPAGSPVPAPVEEGQQVGG